jgi:hypothetical protein
VGGPGGDVPAGGSRPSDHWHHLEQLGALLGSGNRLRDCQQLHPRLCHWRSDNAG